MKIRFFGDSWYWGWCSHSLKSQMLTNLGKKGFPFFEYYLKELNIDYITHCVPGNSFSLTTDSILNINNDSDVKYNIVFFSSHIRRNRREWINEFDFFNYENFINQFNQKTILLLEKIQSWAEENNQQVFLIGGQCTLYKDTFSQLKNNKNLHLISECIITDLLPIQKPYAYGIFKLATDMTDHIDENWDSKIIDHLYEDISKFEKDKNITQVVTWPDSGHLNGTGILLLLDLILEKIEKLEEQL